MDTTKFLLLAWLKRSKNTKKAAGFTLIEVLVAMILAVLVLAPLLGFMINILDSDRKEQAKITSEQELQAATEYISRDLQQAVYIYDTTGIATITNNYNSTTCSSSSTGCSQLPAGSDRIPVLVFWKRTLMPKSAPINTTLTCNTNPNTSDCQENDSFVYSLVAYYLIKKNNPAPWSQTTQIGRFEVKDGVKQPDGTYVSQDDGTVGRDRGFQAFNLNPNANISNQMNAWTKKVGENYTKDVDVLVDYVDQSNLQTNPDNNADLKLQRETCPGNLASPSEPDWKQVPDYSNAGISNTFKTYSFYACPYAAKNTVKVFIRGNALARLRQTSTPPQYTKTLSTFFPTAKIEVKSIGGLGN